MDRQPDDSQSPAAPTATPPSASGSRKPDFFHSQAGVVTIWLGLLTGVITLIAAVLQFLAVRPVNGGDSNSGSQAGNSAGQAHDSLEAHRFSGGSSNGDNLQDSGVKPGEYDDFIANLTYNQYSFEPGYEVWLPDCGEVINTADSDWPSDPEVMLVWHGNADSPVNDIVVRVSELPSDSPTDFDVWLNVLCNTLGSDPANKPEGQLASSEFNGYVWHNLPMSRYNSVYGYQEAIDINMAHYGYQAIGVTFYFPVPPMRGLLESLIPQVLGNLDVPASDAAPDTDAAAGDAAPEA